MARIVVLEDRCKGCLLCTEACPKGLLRLTDRLNRQGYKVVESHDQNACTACGFCALMCPDVALRVIRTQKGGAA